MNKITENYTDNLYNDLRDPAEAAEYLNAALEEGSLDVFLLALKDIASANNISEISRKTELNRVNIYRMLSPKGNPQLKSLFAILHSLGLHVQVSAEKNHKSSQI